MWIEYFKGSEEGLALKRLLNNKNDKFVTMECCISEIRYYCLKNNFDFNRIFGVIKSDSIILPILADLWINAADIKFELRKKIPHFGLIDAILVAKQQELKCKVISGDPHFKTLKNVVYIGGK